MSGREYSTGDSGLRTSVFDYDLPPELIAQQPHEERTSARMLVVDRASGSLHHRTVRDLPDYLASGDVLVVNDTRVIPARIFGKKAETGGKVELLLLEEVHDGIWMALCGSSRRPVPGTSLILAGGRICAQVISWESGGRITVALSSEEPLLDVLESAGVPPLPPYIRRKGSRTEEGLRRDRDYYQTVYARVPGAVAAPTAGLHLTKTLLDQLARKGVPHVTVTLHVGMGTFKPVTADCVESHVMESERYSIPDETSDRINVARRSGGRIAAVGSTVVRTLESVANESGSVKASTGRTRLYIYPPYTFHVVDIMLTNFHLPRSTLLMMVSALAGTDLIRHAYEVAIQEKYRFYSYGDCMLIL